ncbi:hypothetical protein [Actinomycetospora atypica]|uniref:Uncharacterized protein n=1 Tax=Actinomycetospora atypica TaxID=1290095 RepID=A0ABV9YLQ8_9PSEU
MTVTGGQEQDEQDRVARERLTREARQTVTALLDWVGTRVDAPREAGGSERPPQSPGPCGWCPVCALAAALRGEQPQLTASLAEQASGLLVLLRLLVQSHAGTGHSHHAPPTPGPDEAATAAGTAAPPGWPAEWGAPSWAPSGPAAEETAVPWEAPHAMFDPTPATGMPVAVPGEPLLQERSPEGSSPEEPRPGRPTGRRGPRPSPRHPLGATADEAPVAAAPTPPAPTGPAPSRPTARSGVQRIPVRRRSRPC